MKLVATIVALFFFLKAPEIWAAVTLNAFSTDLVRLWTPNTSGLTQHNCDPINDVGALQHMEARLVQASRYDPHLFFHQGALACLQGDTEKAIAVWQGDEAFFPSALFAATKSFAQGQVVKTSLTVQVGEYGYTRGVQERRENNIPAAITWYTFSFSYAPSVETANQLMYLYRSQGNSAQVENVWRVLAENMSSEMPDHWWALGQVAELEENWTTAGEYYRHGALLADAGEAYRFFTREGMAWSRAEEYGQAEDAYQRALAADPKQVDAYLGLGHVSRSNLAYDKASEWYRKAQAVAPENYAPLYYLGLVARTQEHYSEALAYYDQALMLDPGNTGVLYDKAITLEALGRRGEATGVLTEAIAHGGNPPESWQLLLKKWQTYPTIDVDPDHWWMLGLAAEQEKDWQKAAELYDKGANLARPPDDYRLLNREALMRRNLQEWDQAETIYRDLVGRYPDKLDSYLGLGDIAKNRKAYDEANQWYQQAMQADPMSYLPPYDLGVTTYTQGSYETALVYFQKSLSLKPDAVSVLYYKALALKALNRRNEAIKTLEEALSYKNPPGSWEILLATWLAEDK